MSDLQKILLSLGVVIVLVLIFNKKVMGLASMVKNFSIRNDPSGLGTFGAKREGHIHQGLDIKAEPNEPIKAPFDLTFSYSGRVYADDPFYLATEYKTPKGSFRVMYLQPRTDKKIFKTGEVIGFAQNIAKKWGGKMVNHIHVEIRENGILKDPAKYV